MFARPLARVAPSRPRALRRPVACAAHITQPCRLLFGPQYHEFAAYACRITDIANGGYCIQLLHVRGLAPDHLVGMDAYLEQADKTLIPVELRWRHGIRVGLKRLPRGIAG